MCLLKQKPLTGLKTIFVVIQLIEQVGFGAVWFVWCCLLLALCYLLAAHLAALLWALPGVCRAGRAAAALC